jgi:hypothetical protein
MALFIITLTLMVSGILGGLVISKFLFFLLLATVILLVGHRALGLTRC